MGATATLSTTSLVVEPGHEVTCPVIIRNAGTVVDQFAIDVLGDAAAWAAANPATVNLLPGDSATINVVFAPPRSADVLADVVPFGIRVSSHVDPDGSVVEEGAVTVAPFTDVTPGVVPSKVEAARRARYEVAVDNHGNHPVNVRLYPADQEDDLEFRLDRSEFVLAAGMATFARLRVRPRRRFLRGQPRRHPFRVFVTVDDREPIVAEATMVQRQLLPAWLIPVLIALLAFLALVTTLYFAVLRPTITSAARAEVAAQTGHLAAVAVSAQQQASQAVQAASSAKQAVAGKAPSAGTSGSGSQPLPGVVVPSGSSTTATDFRVQADTPVTAGSTKTFTSFQQNPAQPAKTTLLVTDIILQNPFGDSGLLQIQRGGANMVFEVGLANFRDLDYHFVQPLVFTSDKPLQVSVNCQAVGTTGPNDGKCHPAVSFSGQLITPNNGG